MASLKIGELAAAAGVRRDTIRYYEKTGLLPSPDRSGAGYRLYGNDDLLRLNFIRSAQKLGFTLAQTGELLQLHATDNARASAVLKITQEKICEATARIAELNQIREILETLAAECPGDVPAAECPILTFISTKNAKLRGEEVIKR